MFECTPRYFGHIGRSKCSVIDPTGPTTTPDVTDPIGATNPTDPTDSTDPSIHPAINLSNKVRKARRSSL